MRKVVVTGIGLVTPLSVFTEKGWQRIIAGESGVSNISGFSVDDLPCKIAAQLSSENAGFDANDWVSVRDQKKLDSFIIYGLAAAKQALEDAGWAPSDDRSLERTGVIIGSGIGGLISIEKNSSQLQSNGFKKVSPFFLPMILINLLSGHVAMRYGFRGPNHSVVTACATGAHAIGDATCIIQRGDADVMIAGGAEAPLCRIGMAGFSRMGALSTHFNDRPKAASRPWDRDRDGFVMGEGSGILVLEEYEHARQRAANIYGEVLGYGLSGDAYHITAPHPEGRGAILAMRMALRKAKVDHVDYINAHGTSTPLGDKIELKAVTEVFDREITMSSTKSCTGHLLGAAGSVEAILCLLTMRDGVVPPTINLDNPIDHHNKINLVANFAQEKKVKIAMSNSFGFGGTNVSLVFGMPT
jgi:3-oxoacyl-[acyl-carrier-protein] synthase II